MPRETKVKLSSFEDLKTYVDDFESNTPLANSPITTTLPLTNQKLTDNKLRVVLVDDLRSFRVKHEHFTNFIDRKGDPDLKSCIGKILKLDGNLVFADDIPIKFSNDYKGERLIEDDTPLWKIDRYNTIFTDKHIQIDKEIGKSHLLTSKNKHILVSTKDDLARIYYRKLNYEEVVLEILLVDAHHLIAENKNAYKKRYIDVRDFDMCLSDCK